jgi:hypothetical protein
MRRNNSAIVETISSCLKPGESARYPPILAAVVRGLL